MHKALIIKRVPDNLLMKTLIFQAKQLITERWGENVRIEEFVGGKKLVISYWR